MSAFLVHCNSLRSFESVPMADRCCFHLRFVQHFLVRNLVERNVSFRGQWRAQIKAQADIIRVAK